MAGAIICRSFFLRYCFHKINIFRLRQSVVQQSRRPLAVKYPRNQVQSLICGARVPQVPQVPRVPEENLQPFLSAAIVDKIAKEFPNGTPSRSTISQPLASAQNNPQPSFRQRFFDYIHENERFKKSTHRSGGKIEGDLDENFENLKAELSKFLSRCSSEKTSSLSEDSDKEMRSVLENQCFAAAPNLDFDKILILADFWFSISQFDLRVPRFHRTFLDRLAQESSSLSLPQCLQTLLYCAAYRKIQPGILDKLKKVILSTSSNLDTLEMDMDIVAFAAYVLKMNFRPHPDFLSKAANVLLHENVDLSEMVNILKFLRQNDFKNVHFSSKLNDKLRPFSFLNSSGVECCYILQAFASAKFYDEILFEKLQRRILENLREEKVFFGKISSVDLQKLHPSRRLRAKDIASYLYSLSIMNHKIEKTDLIIENLKQRIKAEEFVNLPDFLVQSLYALSLQNIYDADLLSVVFSTTTARKLASNDLKDAQRWLYCLFKNCQIEFPEGIRRADLSEDRRVSVSEERRVGLSEDRRVGLSEERRVGVSEDRLAAGLHRDFFNVGYEMAHRTDKDTMERVKQDLVKKYGREAVDFCRQIPHLEISGFRVRLPAADLLERLKNPKDFREGSLEMSQKIAVEVLDFWTSAVNVKRPLGVFMLKKRLLRKQGWTVEVADVNAKC